MQRSLYVGVLGENAVGLLYGSYLGDWRRRLAIKMWSGWPTYPMVFVKGVLVGGSSELQKLLQRGPLL